MILTSPRIHCEFTCVYSEQPLTQSKKNKQVINCTNLLKENKLTRFDAASMTIRCVNLWIDSKSIKFTIHNSMVVNLIQQHFSFQFKMLKLNLKR